jgi:hypothetical protein
MRYEATLSAYDMIDQVHVTMTLRGRSGSLGAPQEVVLATSTTVQGTGESDPTVWARDALVAILETL